MVHNIIVGVILILVIQWLFLGDFRGAIVVAATIPFAFLFAILLMLLRGESANLLSLGALDFGLLVDATVIMVENSTAISASPGRRRTATSPRPASQELSGLSLTVLRAAGEVDKAIFFSALIIVAAFIPLFTLGGIEGRIFGPMAKTYAYAIVGALFATFTVAPALAAALLQRRQPGEGMPIVRGSAGRTCSCYGAGDAGAGRPCLVLAAALFGLALCCMSTARRRIPADAGGRQPLGPRHHAGHHLLEEGNGTVNRIRGVLMEFPEVITATSQQGRPDDGTDSAGFFNAEFFLPLKPPDEWTTAKNQGRAGACDAGPAVPRVRRHRVQLLPGDLGQRPGGGIGREGRQRHQGLSGRSSTSSPAWRRRSAR